MLYSQNKKRGFTLVELIVVLVILAILAALLIPALTGYIDKSKKSQVIAETRMLHEAIQTELSEAYAGNEWNPAKPNQTVQRATPCTIASSSGRGIYAQERVLSDAADRYQSIVKLSEVPSLQNGTGRFFALITGDAKVHALVYDSGRDYIGVYFRDTQQYAAYKLGEEAAGGSFTLDSVSFYFNYVYYNTYFDIDTFDPNNAITAWTCSGIRGMMNIEKNVLNNS